ncbi:MAG: hypothetical protein GWM90_22005, partial [Gemmatimonadetes bacterium]|nr:hypothetical protein [Gemmatimonadota bacterium]NIQ57244.1 hypothetical protein [Gemmatimonadota bacterium]NIU77409.1 hypothetical protein [Gammaproteobacteria bacterium]NIX46657.1 hypothetical protein [Gemmatimonadota bacterium]NIY10992.1 hypothetical protein [Gemmatimonadota bacterium]
LDGAGTGATGLRPPAPDRGAVATDGGVGLAAAASGLGRVAATLDRLDALAAARDSILGLMDYGCQPVGYDSGALQARRRLVAMVTRARARGLAVEAAGA